MVKAVPGGRTSPVELEKWSRNPNAAANAGSTGYILVRSRNSHVLVYTPKINLQSTASGERWILLSGANAWAMMFFQAQDLDLQKKELL